jgi:hypothetical protein
MKLLFSLSMSLAAISVLHARDFIYLAGDWKYHFPTRQ